MFAKSDEIPSLLVQVKEKPKRRGLKIQWAITLQELASSPYSSIINVHLMDINVFVKFYEISIIAFSRYWKTKMSRTDGQSENGISPPPAPTNSVCGGINIRWVQLPARLDQCYAHLSTGKISETIMGKWYLRASMFIIDRNLVKPAGTQDRYKISDEFEFWPDQTSHFGVICPWLWRKAIDDCSEHSPSFFIRS